MRSELLDGTDRRRTARSAADDSGPHACGAGDRKTLSQYGRAQSGSSWTRCVTELDWRPPRSPTANWSIPSSWEWDGFSSRAGPWRWSWHVPQLSGRSGPCLLDGNRKEPFRHPFRMRALVAILPALKRRAIFGGHSFSPALSSLLRTSFRPFRARSFPASTQGLRPGPKSSAALRLRGLYVYDTVVTKTTATFSGWRRINFVAYGRPEGRPFKDRT
jgi:hypothetical protein